MKKSYYLIAITLCFVLASCGGDEPEPNPTPVNADLIGWWVCPTEYSYHYKLVHFIDDQVLEYGNGYDNWNVASIYRQDVGWKYATTVNNKDVYWTDPSTVAYLRNGNVVTIISNGTVMTIVNGKIRYDGCEYTKQN